MSWVNIPVTTDRVQPGGRLEIFARRMVIDDLEILLGGSFGQITLYRQERNIAVDVVHAIYKNVKYRHGNLPGRICKVCIAVYAQIADDVPSSQSQVQFILNSNLIDLLVDLSILGQNAEPKYYSHALWKYVDRKRVAIAVLCEGLANRVFVCKVFLPMAIRMWRATHARSLAVGVDTRAGHAYVAGLTCNSRCAPPARWACDSSVRIVWNVYSLSLRSTNKLSYYSHNL
jgi:hypothetical protein